MLEKTVIVGSRLGLHARPASIIAQAAASANSPITIQVGQGNPVNAASTMMIIVSGATFGSEVTVAGEDQEAVERVANLIAQDLDEEN